MSDQESPASTLAPLLDLNLPLWRGLPELSGAALDAAFGSPRDRLDVYLGWYPAERATYVLSVPSGGLAAYIRRGVTVMVETLTTPSIEALSELAAPSAVKSHELFHPDAYVHEYLYCEQGLIVSVAEFFSPQTPDRILRVRGIRPLGSPAELGPDLYCALDDQESLRST